MLTTPKAKGGLFLASSLCDGLEDNDIKQVTTLLLNKDADPNVLIPTYGVTPFHLVIGNDSEAFAEEVTKLFLRHGGNPNVKSSDGLTPVHVAAAWGRTTVLELLLANGGDPLCLDDDGHSPFHYAFDGKYHKAIQVLAKYCEDSKEEEDDIKYTLIFDKLRVNNGKETAEYVVMQSPDSINSLGRSQSGISDEARSSYNTDENSFTYSSPESITKTKNNTKLKILKMKAQEVIEREKCLMNEIINQLSTSLKVSSKDKTNNKNGGLKDNYCDLNSSFKLCTKESEFSDTKSKYNLINSAKRRSVASKFRQRVLTENNSNKGIPLSPQFNPNDCIISKSPNFLAHTDKINKETGRSYKTPECKAFTPCTTRRYRAGELSFGKELARSTPRRKKKLNRPCTSVKKYSNRHEQKFTESTSCDSMTSLSPHQDHPRMFHYNFNKNLVIKLDENKYDEDETPKDGSTTNLWNTPKRNWKRFRENLDNSDGDDSDTDSNALKPEHFNAPLLRSQSYISVEEDYKYEDPEKSVALLERRIYTIPTRKDIDLKSESTDSYYSALLSCTKQFSENNDSIEIIIPLPQHLSLPRNLTDDDLRRQLIRLGDNPGPITETTRVLYLKRLNKLKNENVLNTSSVPVSVHSTMNGHLYAENSLLKYGNWVNHLDYYEIRERDVFKDFVYPDPSKHYREGTRPTSFNYILLDPRITQDIRLRHLEDSVLWSTFLSAIFYIGKGNRSRPYQHLYDAREKWKSGTTSLNPRIQYILEIWQAGCGVVCLQIFHNTIPVEAYTREAAMIDALEGRPQGNSQRGTYYGDMKSWNTMEQRKFGRYLLYKALQILRSEGERQIFPWDL